MIHHLDQTLEQLLMRELPAELVEQVTISFETPDDQFPSSAVTLPAIDLFLYDIRENVELRNREWLVDRGGNGEVSKKRAAERVDCSYLVTAWSGAAKPALDEHRLLGEVMKALWRHKTLPPEVLQGELAGQEPVLRAVSLLPGHLQSIGEFWQSLGGKPKAALNYTVTISVDVSEPVPLGPPVTDKRIRTQGSIGEN